MPYVPEKHDEFLAHEVKLSYTERMERITAMKAKGPRYPRYRAPPSARDRRARLRRSPRGHCSSGGQRFLKNSAPNWPA
jgi:hypothetical protein